MLIDQLCSASLLPAITIGSFCLLYCLSSFKPDSLTLEVRRQAHRDEHPDDVDNVQDSSGLSNTKTLNTHACPKSILLFSGGLGGAVAPMTNVGCGPPSNEIGTTGSVAAPLEPSPCSAL